MPESPRFGLIPLPLSMSSLAVVGEFMLDNNSGHIYNKKNDGTVYSKTLELEKRIDEIVLNQQFWRSNITLNGVDLKRFTSVDESLFQVTDVVNVRFKTEYFLLDKLPLDINRLSKYRVSILYRSSNKEIPIPRLFIHRNHGENVDNIISGFLLNKTQRDTEHLINFDFCIPSTDLGGEGYLQLGNILNMTLENIKIEKIPLFDNNLDEITYTIEDAYTLKVGSSKPVMSNFMMNVGRQTFHYYDIGGYFEVKQNQDLVLKLDIANMQPGLYAVTAITEGNNKLKIFGGYKDKDFIKSDGTKINWQDTGTIDTSNLPPIMGGDVDDEERLDAFTTTVPVGPNGINSLTLRAYLRDPLKVYMVSVKLIMAGSYNQVE